MSSLANSLRAARKAKAWTLRDAEAATGISNGYLSLMETGKVSAPGPKYLKTLADVYGLDFTDLMTLAGHPSGPAPASSVARRDVTLEVNTTPPRVMGMIAEQTNKLDSDPERNGYPHSTPAGVGSLQQRVAPPLAEPAAYGVSGAEASAATNIGPSRTRGAIEVKPRIATDDESAANDRATLAELVAQDLTGLTLDEVRQARAFIAGLRAARR